MPPLVTHEPGHWVACHFSDELRASEAVAAVPHGTSAP
jgi:hypothetical protein